jgi:glycosyltransferase involved in cell wall biosynthesis
MSVKVHFVHGGASYLPELAAYRTHIGAWDWQAVVHDGPATVPDDEAVVWWICGRVPAMHARRLRRSWHVHEYASASVPPAAWIKDRVKRWTHPRPDHRVFQSEWVRRRMGFSDGVGSSLRDMGVPSTFLAVQPQGEPEFDFVYLGETSRLASFLPALAAMLDARLSLLVVGSVAPSVRDVLPRFANVRCIGRIAHADVPAQLLRARAGLNLVPTQLPFTEQTSTKFLEYLAVGLPVVSNDYPWAQRMAGEYPGRVRLLPGLDASAWRRVATDLPGREHERGHLRSLTWDERLRGLPVWDAIRAAGAAR